MDMIRKLELKMDPEILKGRTWRDEVLCYLILQVLLNNMLTGLFYILCSIVESRAPSHFPNLLQISLSNALNSLFLINPSLEVSDD